MLEGFDWGSAFDPGLVSLLGVVLGFLCVLQSGWFPLLVEATDTGSCCACVVLILSLQRPSEVEKKKSPPPLDPAFRAIGANPVVCIFTICRHFILHNVLGFRILQVVLREVLDLVACKGGGGDWLPMCF